MSLLEPVLVIDLFPLERQSLLQLLAQLSEEEWYQPTVCAGWTVKDIALHVLGDDIGLLSRKRDAFELFTSRLSLLRGMTWWLSSMRAMLSGCRPADA